MQDNILRVSTDSEGNQGNGDSSGPSISADGRLVAFWSRASDLVDGDTNGAADIFVKDLATGVTSRVSTDSAGNQADRGSYMPSISADGRYVVFSSRAYNLVADDTNGSNDTFVKDLVTGETIRVNTDSAGLETTGDNGWSMPPSISADGRYVAFLSKASNLVADDTNGWKDVFVKDLVTGATTRVNTDSAGQETSGYIESCAISADGRYVAFEGSASNLVDGDTNGHIDVFVKDLTTGETTRVSTDSAGREAYTDLWSPPGLSISADGSIRGTRR